MVFIAGGIGITPFRSILLNLEHQKAQSNILLLYANRTEDAPFRSEIEQLRKRLQLFEIKYFFGRKHLDGSGIRAAVPNLMKRKFYVSGPKAYG